ncbi:hypothetical protein F2Q70_00042112 [Brassica cretica]|uniref:V-SNARE coiled-coil homology domain-containing protein n=1 Tax=Brassica cretica TaxID=69181 RepID=A0A8S9K3B1_BRACR|nr:hypothetical protein F2Q70_00042112 [Brassica cretica]
MGKKAKKKARTPTKENLTKKVSEHPSEIAEEAVKEKQACVHFDKGLNLDKVLEKIKSSRVIKCHECKEGLLVDKTENLRSQAQDFRTTGTQMRRKMWLQNMKIKLIVLAIIVALILIIVLSVCHGFKC